MITLLKGTEIICITKKLPDVLIAPPWLTVGEVYTLMSDYNDDNYAYDIIGDNEKRQSYNKRYFITIAENRQRIIDNIIKNG